MRSATVRGIAKAGTGDVGILILGGGEATRLPGKLALAAGDVPLIVRVYRNFAALGNEICVASQRTFEPQLDALLPVPLVIDRWARRGPLAGTLSAFGQMRSRFVFAVAGDAPFVDAGVLRTLLAARRPGDEAVVPERRHEGEALREPLAALYDRLAFVKAALPVLRGGRGSLLLALEGLRTRFVPFPDGHIFTNVNTPRDYAALLARLGEPT
jgi:molybdopterin-guanine dinucleotide biosynthesis protein A